MASKVIVQHFTNGQGNARVSLRMDADALGRLVVALPDGSPEQTALLVGMVNEAKRNASRDAKPASVVAPIVREQASKPASKPASTSKPASKPEDTRKVKLADAWAVARENGHSKVTSEDWATARERVSKPAQDKPASKPAAKASKPSKSSKPSKPAQAKPAQESKPATTGDKLDELIRSIVAQTA